MTTPLGIIAGGGELPHAIAQAARDAGRPVFVVALELAGDWARDFPHDRSSMGRVGKTLRLLRAHGCNDVVFAGYVDRPNFRKLSYDLKGLAWLPRVAWGMRRGDNTLLDVMVGLFEREGLSIKSIDTVAPWLQIDEGPLGSIAPSPAYETDIAIAIAAARAQGARDVGQAVIVRDGKVVAMEGPEGTDAMLKALVVSAQFPGGVLAKALKPQQTRKSDLPTIGVTTVELAARCGLAGIAVEARTALVMDKAAVAATADALRLFVVGVPAAS